MNCWIVKKIQVKKDKDKKKSNISVTFLTEQLLHVQVKLMEIDNRPETRHVEYETDELTKQHKWSSTDVKSGVFLLPFCVLSLSTLFSDLCFLYCSVRSGQEGQVTSRPNRAEWLEDKGWEMV